MHPSAESVKRQSEALTTRMPPLSSLIPLPVPLALGILIQSHSQLPAQHRRRQAGYFNNISTVYFYPGWRLALFLWPLLSVSVSLPHFSGHLHLGQCSPSVGLLGTVSISITSSVLTATLQVDWDWSFLPMLPFFFLSLSFLLTLYWSFVSRSVSHM